eukprot:Seg2838.8 transcript_id=Seg2838.8/GoldUCD/mRNA.D3Y31 product="Protein AAR2" protein_id=Seg2838.8/GoldUCD/D3Y31
MAANISQHAVLVENVPKGIEFGIDYNTWFIGPRFSGIQSIPDGFHFVFTSNVKGEQHSPRNGLFLYLNKDSEADSVKCSLHRSSWDERNEEMTVPFKRCSSESLADENTKGLAPYPIDEKYQTWKQLTNFITKDTIDRLAPSCGRISPLTQVDCTAELEKKERKRLKIDEKEPAFYEELKIRFTVIPEKKYPDGATPADITKYSMDHSFALESMLQSLEHLDGEEELLGEIQFAFVCFMIGQVFDAFEHWKTIIRLICNCDDAVHKRPQFFIKFFGIIELQIKEIPEDFFVDIVAEQNFLVQTLQILFSTLLESDNLDKRLVEKSEHLKTEISDRFNWSFEFEDDEEQPVIVDGI